MIEAGAARGRRIASYPSLRTDPRNAGAEWVDEEVVIVQSFEPREDWRWCYVDEAMV